MPVCFINSTNTAWKCHFPSSTTKRDWQLCFELMNNGFTLHAQYAFPRSRPCLHPSNKPFLPAKSYHHSFAHVYVFRQRAMLFHPNASPSRFSRKSLPRENQRKYISFFALAASMNLIRFTKWTINRRQKRSALQINDRQFLPFALMIVCPCPGCLGGKFAGRTMRSHRRSNRKFLCYPMYDCPS